MHKIKNYFYHVVIAIDQLANAITGGAADETISSRAYRKAKLKTQPKIGWVIAYHAINALFWDKSHCKEAYESEINYKQHDKDFRAS